MVFRQRWLNDFNSMNSGLEKNREVHEGQIMSGLKYKKKQMILDASLFSISVNQFSISFQTF
jgi:hypothetical protein